MSSLIINTITIFTIIFSLKSSCNAQMTFNDKAIFNVTLTVASCAEELYSDLGTRQVVFQDLYGIIYPNGRLMNNRTGCVVNCIAKRMGFYKDGEGSNLDHSLKHFKELAMAAGAPEITADILAVGVRKCHPKLSHNDDSGNCGKSKEAVNCFKGFVEGQKFD